MILIDFAILIVALTTIFWMICLIFAQIFGAPTVYSSSKAIIDTLNLADLKKDQLLIDLGCGNARTLIIGAKKFGARGIGVDRSPYCFVKSKLNVFFAGQSRKVKIIYGDFSKVENNLPKADVVYLYLLNSVNGRLENWLFKNISEKTRVVSLAFTFNKHMAKKSIWTKTLRRKTQSGLYMKN
jgi:SAM-dependent methyltransferase